ncbi:MAG TPA: hypothetical protein VHI98_28680, partial [Vicinamibacterales bacterium]|nr:hypothetical protein [Vicinamibacterales bacterium]
QSTAKALGLAIERKERHEREQAERRRAHAEAEKNSHKEAVCGNDVLPVSDVPESDEVVKH